MVPFNLKGICHKLKTESFKKIQCKENIFNGTRVVSSRTNRFRLE